MVKRLVDIDDELLARAKEALGVDTMKDAVNQSLEEVVKQQQRRAWIDWVLDHTAEFQDEELQRGLHRELPVALDD